MKNRKRVRSIKYARKQAEKIVIRTVQQGVSVKSVKDLISTVENITGIRISVATAPLEPETFGESLLNRQTRQCKITISESCGTWEHTLAHELAHIVLRHDHCGADNISIPTPEFEGLAEIMTVGTEARNHAEQWEQEAEAFADEVLRLLEYTVRGADSSTLTWAAALTA